MSSNGRVVVEESRVPLLDYASSTVESKNRDDEEISLKEKFWIESKKLWQIAGPAMFSRLATYSMLVITQAFAGHLGDLDLASISIATNVVLGFDFGLMVLVLQFINAHFH